MLYEVITAAQAAKAKAEQAAKEKAQQEAKAKAEKAKQDKLAKEKAAKEAKAKAQKDKADAKQLEDELFSDSNDSSEPAKGAAKGPSAKSNTPSNSAGLGGSGGGDPGYGDKVAQLIQQRMLIDQSMKNREAIVKIRLAPDGLVLGATCISGDASVCRAGITAVNLIGKFPKPPDEASRTINATLQPLM